MKIPVGSKVFFKNVPWAERWNGCEVEEDFGNTLYRIKVPQGEIGVLSFKSLNIDYFIFPDRLNPVFPE